MLTFAVNFLSEVVFIINILKKIGLFVSFLCYILVTLNGILKIVPSGSFGIAHGYVKSL